MLCDALRAALRAVALCTRLRAQWLGMTWFFDKLMDAFCKTRPFYADFQSEISTILELWTR